MDSIPDIWPESICRIPDRDCAVDHRFAQLLPLLYDPITAQPLHQKDRLQNHSSMMGICVDIFDSTGSGEALRFAEKLADLVLSFQQTDGGLYKENTDYTSVIYPAKSLMELVEAEQKACKDDRFPKTEQAWFCNRIRTHMEALTRMMDHLAQLDGNFSTEGATTSCYEDGANSCSATQLSQFALMFPQGSPQRDRYAVAARKILDRYSSHEQILIPDSRIVGGTLRYWEAQYDVEMEGTPAVPQGQMMDSPHGWSTWSIYALFHVYELTGDVRYLRRGMNAMGSCVQLMSFSGELRWAFVPDSQRLVRPFVPDPDRKGGGIHVERTISEEYVPMISTWWTAPEGTWIPGYTKMGGFPLRGACCDNDVHGVFKAMEETVLTRSYAAELEGGSWLVCNTEVHVEGAVVKLLPSEELITAVSILVQKERKICIEFESGAQEVRCIPGKPCWFDKVSAEPMPEAEKQLLGTNNLYQFDKVLYDR